MELTPQVFRDVQFREKLRGGYHPEDVDEFLEQAALAAEEMEGRLKSALERAERAERALADASASDETLKRVLVMAQRTADDTVREARDEAERLLAEARLQAQSIVAEAEERGRRAYESKLLEARSNLERTEEALRRAQSDAEVVARWAGANKAQLVQALREAADSLERVGSGEEPPALRLPGQEAEQPGREKFGGESGAAGNPPPHVGAGGPGGRQPGSTPSSVPAGPAPGPAASVPAGARGGASDAQDEGGGPGSGTAGGWDPRFLDDLDDGPSQVKATDQGHAGTGNAGLGTGAYLGGPPSGDSAGEDTQPGGRVPASARNESLASSGQDDSTVAFDEEALDSFFREQDLHVKGPGRFRRRT